MVVITRLTAYRIHAPIHALMFHSYCILPPSQAAKEGLTLLLLPRRKFVHQYLAPVTATVETTDLSKVRFL